ncbi:MAG: hypothetical protein ACRD82_14790, partial [Blastocatellia bacterium]
LGLVVLVFAIFASAWLNLHQIMRMMESLKGEMRAERNELKAEIKALEHKIDYGLASVKTELSSVNSRVERLEPQLDKAFNLTLK